MPLYELECINCKKVNEFLMGLSEAPTTNEEVDLKDLKLKCEKCGKTKFKRIISAHGKTASNWASWQEGLG